MKYSSDTNIYTYVIQKMDLFLKYIILQKLRIRNAVFRLRSSGGLTVWNPMTLNEKGFK